MIVSKIDTNTIKMKDSSLTYLSTQLRRGAACCACWRRREQDAWAKGLQTPWEGRPRGRERDQTPPGEAEVSRQENERSQSCKDRENQVSRNLCNANVFQILYRRCTEDASVLRAPERDSLMCDHSPADAGTREEGMGQGRGEREWTTPATPSASPTACTFRKASPCEGASAGLSLKS